QVREHLGLLGVLCVEVVVRGPAAHRHEMILGRVDRDAIEPGVEGAVATERGSGPVSLEKRLLRNVHRFGGVSDVSHDQLENLVLVLDHQQIERRSVALLHASNQREVRRSASLACTVGLLCQTLFGRPHAAPKSSRPGTRYAAYSVTEYR